jgi:hypothetical protein
MRRDHLRHHKRCGTSGRGVLGRFGAAQPAGADRQAEGVYSAVDGDDLGEDEAGRSGRPGLALHRGGLSQAQASSQLQGPLGRREDRHQVRQDGTINTDFLIYTV